MYDLVLWIFFSRLSLRFRSLLEFSLVTVSGDCDVGLLDSEDSESSFVVVSFVVFASLVLTFPKFPYGFVPRFSLKICLVFWRCSSFQNTEQTAVLPSAAVLSRLVESSRAGTLSVIGKTTSYNFPFRGRIIPPAVIPVSETLHSTYAYNIIRSSALLSISAWRSKE